MDVSEIKTLLKRFYDGQTSAGEEAALRDALCNKAGLPPELHEESAFFNRLYASPDVPDGLEQRISRQIDNWNTVEKATSRKARSVSLKWITGVAAGIVIMFSVGLWMNRKPDVQQFSQQQDTYDNAQDAYVHTHDALMKMSLSLNKGLDEVEKINRR